MIDLDAYFERIGYPGPRAVSLEVLQAIHALHPAAIPFENLNPLLGIPVALDVDSLQAKMVSGGRGGWCFEHNTLFRNVLEALGFQVAGLGARVLWNAPPGGPIAPRSHMVLLVTVDGAQYIADVGFGGNVLTAPLRVEPHVEQSTPHEPHRLMPLEFGLVLEANLRGEWMQFYRFTLEPQFPMDYEVANWHLCHHPSSFFRTTLLGALATPEARYALRNNELSIHRKDATEKRTLTTAAELRACLENDFQIRLPDAPDLEATLKRLTQPAT